MTQILLCEVVEVLEHGGRVYSVFLKPGSPAHPFLPGQFLRLSLDEFKPNRPRPETRDFSIASSPTDRHLLRITYAVKGIFSGRMEKELKPGSRVWVDMPYGEFVVKSDRDVCLLAGGTGVTAFIAFLGGLAPGCEKAVHFFYGARNPRLLIYRRNVEVDAVRCPALHAHFLAEYEAESAGCLPGRIRPEVIFQYVSDPLSVTYYLAGPPGMRQNLPIDLQQRGVPADQIVTDAWE